MHANLYTGARRLAPLLLATALPAGCNDEAPPPEPMVETVELTVGTQVVEVPSTGASITISGNTSVSARFLKADGTVETLVTADEFELRLESADTGVVTFTRSGPFAGTLNKVAAGQTTIEVILFHTIEQHEDFGPHPVTITVN